MNAISKEGYNLQYNWGSRSRSDIDRGSNLLKIPITKDVNTESKILNDNLCSLNVEIYV